MESPVPQKQNKLDLNTYNFYEALKLLVEGKKIKRLAWEEIEEGSNDYGYMKDGKVMIYTKGSHHIWVISDGDATAEDWIVIE